ncbi:MAG: transglycosylase SLT domain-containing protein [Betaproteobacteria bacterium]|nr:transglycosylase SLT domain-containing protein [Betaproteobacteria bacterium]
MGMMREDDQVPVGRWDDFPPQPRPLMDSFRDGAVPYSGTGPLQISPEDDFANKVQMLTKVMMQKNAVGFEPGKFANRDPHAVVLAAMLNKGAYAPAASSAMGQGTPDGGDSDDTANIEDAPDNSEPMGEDEPSADQDLDSTQDGDGTIDYAPIIDDYRGAPYRQDRLHPKTHYNESIDRTPGRIAGNSRIVGDASPETKRAAVDSIIAAAREAGLNTRETAHALAIAHLESGFNPDAAAGSSTATGLGQITDPTAVTLGLSPTHRWTLANQAKGFVKNFLRSQAKAENEGLGEEYIYKFHHDGLNSTVDKGEGLGIAAKNKLMERVKRYEKILSRR